MSLPEIIENSLTDQLGNLSLRQENHQSSPDQSILPSQSGSGSLGGRGRKADIDHNQPGPSGRKPKRIRQSGQDHKQTAQDKSRKGSEEGRLYEKLVIALLAKRGYELSKSEGNEYSDFSVGREIKKMGDEEKFDDVVFKYKDQDNKYNLIFLQLKHKQDDYKINSGVLSGAAGRYDVGNMAKNFNLQKYFISYMNIKRHLNVTENKNIKDGRLKYMAIFTNAALDTVELERAGFKLKKASDDAENLFTLEGQTFGNCYQLLSINDELRKILEESSDKHRVAKELAKYVAWENYSQEKIMKISEVPIKNYHVALKRKVIDKCADVSTDKKKRKYCEGKFKNDFIDSDNEPWSKDLRDAILEAIRVLAKKNLGNDELKKNLRDMRWRLEPGFGVESKKRKVALPNEWREVSEQDIDDFLKHLLLIVNQPRVQELEALINDSTSSTVLKGTPLRRILEEIENVGPEFRERIEKVLGIYQETKTDEKWISGEEIVVFVQEQSRVVEASFIVTAVTLIYESEVMQYGRFGKLGKLSQILDIFLQNNDKKVLRIATQETTLSSLKILQHFSVKEGYKAEDGRISLNSEILKGEGKNSVIKAFESERNSLLMIECRYAPQEEDSEELYNRLSDILMSENGEKKQVVLITQEHDLLPAKFEKGFLDKYIGEKDERISLTDFTEDSQEKLLKKGTVLFQGEGVRLDALIDERSKHLVDGGVLSKIIHDEEIVIGKAITDSKYGDVKDYYIERKLSRQVKIRQEVRREESEFLVTNSSQVDESKLEINKDIMLISDAGDIFKVLCAEHKEHNIHWLKEEGGDLIWKQSYGDLSKLRRFVDVNAEAIQEYKPEKITDITDSMVIIAAEPGMGKSTILTPLALKTKKHNPSLWVVRVNLLNYSTELKIATQGKIKLNEEVEAMKFLYRAAGFLLFQEDKEATTEKKKERKRTIEKVLSLISVKDSEISLEGAGEEIKGLNLLEIGLFNHFYNQGKTVLLFDGFDEISPDYKDQAIQLLEVLKGGKAAKIWVATRSYNTIQNELEDKLSVFSYSLKPLLREEQRELLRKFWKAKLNLRELDEQRSGVFINELLDKLPQSTGDRDFMSIPLHASMVAEVFKDAFKSFYDSNEHELSDKNKQEIEKQDQGTLYERFIDVKFHEIRFREKKPGMNTDDPDILGMIESKYDEFKEDHRKLALYAIFDEDQVVKLISKEKLEEVTKLIHKISPGKEKTGLIERVVDNKPRFVHRTFAEYFAASYFWETFKSVPFEDFFENFIIKNLIKDDRIQISKFLQLKAKKDLESNIDFPNKQDKLRALLTELLDQYDLDGNNRLSTKLLFGIIEFSFLTKEGSDLGVTEITDKRKLLRVSAEMGYIKLVNALETKLDTNFLKDDVGSYKWFYNPFWLAAENAHLDVLGILVKKKKYDPRWGDAHSKTLVAHIFQRKAFNVLRSCLKLDVLDGKPYKNFNGKKELLIVSAFNARAPSDVIKLLLKKTDSNLVNKFKYSVEGSTLSPAQLIGTKLFEYDKEITELVIEKGIDLSLVTNVLLWEFEMSLIGTVHKLISHYSGPSFHSDGEFLNLFERIELLLKSGVGYNNKKEKENTTTLQYAERIYYMHMLLDGVHKLHNQNNDKSCNLLGTILKLIIDKFGRNPDLEQTGETVNYEFKGYSSKQKIRLWLRYEDTYLGYNNQISLLPDNMPKLFQSWHISDTDDTDGSDTDLVKNTLDNIRDYVTIAEKEIKAFKQYPDNENGKVTESYKDMLEDGFHGFSPNEEDKRRYESLGLNEKDLLERALNLYIRQDYKIDDALEEVSEVVLGCERIISRLKEISGHRNYETEEILDILALESIDTNEELQDLISKIYECGGIELLRDIWSDLNGIGQQKLIEVLKLLFKFSDQSRKIFNLLKKLDDSFKKLIKAIENKNYQKMNKTLSIEPDFIKATVNGQDDEYGSLLHYAAGKGDVDATRILLDHGANRDLRVRGKSTILSLHSTTEKDYYNGCTPLHFAILNGHFQVAGILVSDFDADVNAEDDYGRTPLHIAASKGNAEAIQILLELGANPNAEDDSRRTPLYIATCKGNAEAIRILRNLGVNPNAEDNLGNNN